MPLARKGERGKGRSPCPRPAHRSRIAIAIPIILRMRRENSLNVKAVVHAEVLGNDKKTILGGHHDCSD